MAFAGADRPFGPFACPMAARSFRPNRRIRGILRLKLFIRLDPAQLGEKVERGDDNANRRVAREISPLFYVCCRRLLLPPGCGTRPSLPFHTHTRVKKNVESSKHLLRPNFF